MDNLVENLIRQYMREKVDLRGQIRKKRDKSPIYTEQAKSRLTSENSEETLKNLLANQSIFPADNNNNSELNYLIQSLYEGNTNENSKDQIWSSIENLMASKESEKSEEQAGKTREALYFIIDASLVSDPSKVSTNNEIMGLNQGIPDESLVQNPRDPRSMRTLGLLASVASSIREESVLDAAKKAGHQLDWQDGTSDASKGYFAKKQKKPEELEKENKMRENIKNALNNTSLWNKIHEDFPKLKDVINEIHGVLGKLSEEREENAKWNELKDRYSSKDIKVRSAIVRKIFPVKKSIFPNSDSKRTSLGDNANYLSITQTGIESNSDDLGMVRRKIMDVFHGRNKVNRVSN